LRGRENTKDPAWRSIDARPIGYCDADECSLNDTCHLHLTYRPTPKLSRGMSLFRRSSAAVVSAAVASTSRPPSARLLASLPVVCPNRSRLDQASTSRSFSCSLASTYPRAQRPQPRRLSEFEREPNESTRTTRTVEYEPESEPIEDDIHAPVAASEPKASKPPAKRQVVKELPAKLNENQVVESGEVLSRKKFQKYSKTHVFVRPPAASGTSSRTFRR
jgi:hypothetical protein